MFNAMEFRLKRVSKRLTIRKLAALIEYTPVWLSMCENELAVPSPRLIKTWRKALEEYA